MTRTLADRWRRLGGLPALHVVVGSYAVLFPITLALDNPARRIAGSILLASLVLHCLARPQGGWGVFFLTGVACATCTIVDDILALPRETGLALFPLAVMLAWYEDHPDEEEQSTVTR